MTALKKRKQNQKPWTNKIRQGKRLQPEFLQHIKERKKSSKTV